MTDLLIAFVIPVLVVIIAAILQSILHCPFKVAGIVFVLLIIAALALGGTILLIAFAWIYTVLAFIVAYLICRCFRWNCRCNCGGNNDDNNNGSNNGNGNTGNNNSGNNNSGNNNNGNNNSGNNNNGNNNSGNNNTGNNNSGNNTGNNNGGNNNGNNDNNGNCNCWRGWRN